MKGPGDLTTTQSITLVQNARCIRASYADTSNRIAGTVVAYPHTYENVPEGLWVCGGAHATDGYGPMLYHAVMEQVSTAGWAFCSDRGAVSTEAAAVWAAFKADPINVQSHILPQSLWRNLVTNDRLTEEQKEALKYAYSKERQVVLNELRRLGKLVTAGT